MLARQAWDKRPDYDAAPGLLAVSLLAQGRAPEAVAPARASMEADPADPTIHMLLAQAYRASGRLEDALERQREAIRLGGGRAADDFGPWITLAELESEVGLQARVPALLDSARVRGAPSGAMRHIGSHAPFVTQEQGFR